jgi:LacI family transcriptional regulator, repressor for deo operon, udp, cdd, tsx, nupC, and nupG
MSTITDVAQAAGVSVATVSRALRGLDRVSPQTREKVLRIAAELNFVASPTATSLALGRTRVVAVVAPFLTRWFFASLVSAIDRTLRDHDHYALLFDLEDDSYDRRRRLTQNMLWKRVDGVITLNIPVDVTEQSLIDRLNLPLVAVGTAVPGRPLVRIDDARAAEIATEHVIALGHRRVAYVGSVPDIVAHIQTPLRRRDSFKATMAAHGLPLPPHFIVDAEWTALSAAREAVSILTGPDRPTAVVAASDEMALGVIQTARRLGIDVPRDLSVIGIDDYILSEVMDLTTVRQDVVAQGRLAAEMLLGLIDSGAPSSEVRTIPTELVIRGTTAAAPL